MTWNKVEILIEVKRIPSNELHVKIKQQGCNVQDGEEKVQMERKKDEIEEKKEKFFLIN